jgi:hypothetical protein
MSDTQLLVWPNGSPAPTMAELSANPDVFWSFQTLQHMIIDTAKGTSKPVLAIPLAGAGNLTPLSMDGVNHLQIYPPTSRALISTKSAPTAPSARCCPLAPTATSR